MLPKVKDIPHRAVPSVLFGCASSDSSQKYFYIILLFFFLMKSWICIWWGEISQSWHRCHNKDYPKYHRDLWLCAEYGSASTFLLPEFHHRSHSDPDQSWHQHGTNCKNLTHNKYLTPPLTWVGQCIMSLYLIWMKAL